MAKKLVTDSNLDDVICKASNAVYAEGLIITAGAKDELRRRGVNTVYSPKPAGGGVCNHAHECPHPCSSPSHGEAPAHGPISEDLENLLIAVAGMLKKEHGITDAEKLRTMSCEIVKTLKSNL